MVEHGTAWQRARTTRRRLMLAAVLPTMFLVAVTGDRVDRPARADDAAGGRANEGLPGAGDEFPGPGTVGHAADVPGRHKPAALRVHEGDLVTVRDGQRVQGLDITGALVVRHRGVVATDFRANSVSVASTDGTASQASAELRWCTVGVATGNTSTYNAVGLGNFSIYRCDLFGAVDLVKIRHGYARIQESWLHDPVQWASDPGQGGAPSHVDLVQTSLQGDVASIVITGNRFDAWAFRPPQRAGDTYGDIDGSRTSTGYISILQHQTAFAIDRVHVEGNRFDGPAWRCFYVIHDGGGGPAETRIVGNVLVRNFPEVCREATLSATTPSAIAWGGNVDEHGVEVTAAGTRLP